MKTLLQFTGALIAITIFISCNQPVQKQIPIPSSATVIGEQIRSEEQVVPTPTKVDLPIQPTRTKVFNISEQISSDGVKQLAYTIDEHIIDSLNKIVPIYDSTKFNPLAITYFTALAESLSGRSFFVNHADSIFSTVMDILTTRLNDGTDIVFLIDKTASMDDDIEKVQAGLSKMMDYLAKFENVKVAIAEYGDKNWHYDLWYNKVDLTSDINSLRDFLEEYKTIGNPDIAESVNDAIVRTVREMNWTTGNRRMILVIGDAPSQEPPYTDFSNEQVVNACDSANVLFNLYPIVMAVNQEDRKETFVKKEFVKTYPNPVNESLVEEFVNEGNYYLRVIDMMGRIEQEFPLSGRIAITDFTLIPSGNYLIEIFDQNRDRFYSNKIIVQH